MKTKKVFIGPHEVAGYYSNLAKGLRECGSDCDFITYSTHPFNYGGESRSPKLLELVKQLSNFRNRPSRPFFIRLLLTIPVEILTFIWSLYATLKYDVFIFGFGDSLMPRTNWDLLLLRLLGKTVISNLAHGSEARPPYINGALRDEEGNILLSDLQKHTLEIKKKVERIHRYSTLIIGAPYSTSQFSNFSFINSFALGLPTDVRNSLQRDGAGDIKNEQGTSVRILHSPSHPVAKGSEKIKEVISNLQKKGYQIEFIMIQDMDHSEVIREIQKCDFVVDQMYSDTPMAGFVTESAFYAKPAVVAGYDFEGLKEFVPKSMWPPSKTCHPNDMEKAIESLITQKDIRRELGLAAQEFVLSKWSAIEVARRYLRLIDGDIPNDWWIDATSVFYVEGYGQSEEKTRENIRAMVKQFGKESLQLGHRLELERAFLEFANLKSD